jgi:hypothetical protein
MAAIAANPAVTAPAAVRMAELSAAAAAISVRRGSRCTSSLYGGSGGRDGNTGAGHAELGSQMPSHCRPAHDSRSIVKQECSLPILLPQTYGKWYYVLHCQYQRRIFCHCDANDDSGSVAWCAHPGAASSTCGRIHGGSVAPPTAGAQRASPYRQSKREAPRHWTLILQLSLPGNHVCGVLCTSAVSLTGSGTAHSTCSKQAIK